MKILVAYASRHGATAGIAKRIAADMSEAGLSADARPVWDVEDLAPYDAFVIGSAAYMRHWLRAATAFVKRHRSDLASRPVWLFSSGPLGTDRVDDEGRDVLEATRPKEFERLRTLINPRGERVFYGAWDPETPAIGLGERMLRLLPAAGSTLPEGDFRDWPAIDAWADEIAAEVARGTHP